MLIERRRVVGRAGLVLLWVEEVGWRWAMVRLRHHAGVGVRDRLVGKERAVELCFSRRRCFKESEVRSGIRGREEVLLLEASVLGLGAKRGVVGPELVGKVLVQVEGR